MLEVSIRLRRAIRANDLELVKRICRVHPKHIVNPDSEDKGNTSLHTAADLGLFDIADFLVEAGHEGDGITRNYDLQTPLMVAAASTVKHAQVDEVARLLISEFHSSIELKDKWGHTALILASKNGNDLVLARLLEAGAYIDAVDSLGNTSLHYASAYGSLKCIRTLIDKGANAEIVNRHGWVAHAYSYEQPAETYFLSLIKSKGLTKGMTSKAAADLALAAQQERANIRMVGSIDAVQMRAFRERTISDADGDNPGELQQQSQQRYSEDQDKDGI